MSSGRIFLLESPNALDLLDGTGESTSLSQVCRLFGHDIASFLIRDQQELNQTFMYISSVGWRKERGNLPIFIHISTHGNDDGLAIGTDFVSWEQLSTLVIETFRNIYDYDLEREPYQGPIILVVSACGTNGMKLTEYLRAAYQDNELEWPPEYIFVFEDTEIEWQNAVVAWTMFYKEAPNINFLDSGDRASVQELLNRISGAGYGNLRYFRWDRDRHHYRTRVPNLSTGHA